MDPDEAVGAGARDAAASFAEAQAIRDRMAADVLPLLPAQLRAEGEALLARMAAPPPDPRLVHGDLGPEHIRVVGDAVTGVIDWGDCCVGDPALDLAWTRYGGGAGVRGRARDGVLPRRRRSWPAPATGTCSARGTRSSTASTPTGPSYVESGLAGVVTRLRRSAEPGHAESSRADSA